MQITQLDNKNIIAIRPLWEKLNRLHAQSSTHFKEFFENFTFEDRQNRFLENEELAIFAATDGSNIAGYCVACMNNGRGEIDSLFVLPEHRGNKIGDSLIKHAEAWLESRRATGVIVRVIEGNESALGFYGRQGYVPRYTVLQKKT